MLDREETPHRFSRRTFLAGFGLGTVAGVGLAIRTAEIVFPEKVIEEAQVANLTDALVEAFNQNFDRLLANLKESNAPTVKNLPLSHQGHQFQVDEKTYALIASESLLNPKTVTITSATKILKVRNQEMSLYFVVEGNRLIKIIQKKVPKPAQTPSDSSEEKKVDILSELGETIAALEADFEIWKAQKN